MMYAPSVSCDGFAGRHKCATQQGCGEKVVHWKVQASSSFACSCPSGWPEIRRRAKSCLCVLQKSIVAWEREIRIHKMEADFPAFVSQTAAIKNYRFPTL